MFGTLNLGNLSPGAYTSTKGVGFSLQSFMASQADGLWFDSTNTDRYFQESVGPTLADDTGEAIGLALDQRSWGGKTLAQVVAASTELVTDPSFSSPAAWSAQTGWSVAGGQAVANAAAFVQLGQVFPWVAGRLYRMEIVVSAVTSGGVRLRPISGTEPAATTRTSPGTYVEYLIANNNTNLSLQAGVSGFVGTVDSVSVKEVPGNHGVQASATLKPFRQPDGAKFDGSDDSWLTGYYPASGPNFVVARVTVPAAPAAFQAIAGSAGNGTDRFFIGVDATGKMVGGVGTNSIGTIVGTSDIRGRDVVVGLTCSGAAVTGFVDAAIEYSGVQAGTPTAAYPIRIGSSNPSGTPIQFWGGSIKALVAGREYLTLPMYLKIRAAMLA